MKQRMLTGWSVPRVLYLLLGGIVVAQAVTEHQWIGAVFGGYFAAMGLFNFGCAAGGCYGTVPAPQPKRGERSDVSNIEFEEIKSN